MRRQPSERTDRNLGADHERGAIAVMTAVSMMVILGLVAIVVDIGAIYFERTQLQTGADAAALALAQNCAKGSCGDLNATATSLAGANANDNYSGAQASVSGNSVSVQTSTLTSSGGTGLIASFAQVFGIKSTTVTATSTAGWGSPTTGPAVLPLAFSYCAFNHTSDVEQVIRYDTNRPADPCTYQGGTTLPGGFGWIQHVSPQCTVQVGANINGGVAYSDPGNNLPSDCYGTLQTVGGQTVLLPVYGDQYGNGGSGGWYKIIGFAAFHLTGWRFSGGSDGTSATDVWNSSTTPSCTGNCRGIKGYFTRFVSLDESFDLGGPTGLGASVVKLTQ